MNVWVPYTVLQTATRISLIECGGVVHYVELDGWPGAYARYWQHRWTEARRFINVEHDVVVWPGALRQLWECPEPWCAYGYHLNDDFADRERTSFPYLGCVKLSAELIVATQGLWDGATDWLTLDGWLAGRAREAGVDVHQHYPPVVNANPVLLA